MNNYKECIIVGGPLNSNPFHPTAPYQDTCFVAQLAYVNAPASQPGAVYDVSLAEAWLVFPADKMPAPSSDAFPFPEVTVIDKTGEAIP